MMRTTFLRQVSKKSNRLSHSGLRSLPRRTHFSSDSSSSQEIAALRQEIQTLQKLLKEQNAQFQGVTKQLKDHSNQLEKNVGDIQDKISMMAAPLDIVASAVSLVQNNPALTNLMVQLERISRGWINRYTVGGLIVSLVGLWSYRKIMYERTSQEVAEIAARTLRQESLQRSVQETLDSIVNSPETMTLLQDLLQKVMNDPVTLEQVVKLTSSTVQSPQVYESLMKLIQHLLAEPAVQKQASEFLLLGLDMPPVKVMLEEQTQSLVRETVLNRSVQEAAATGVKQSLWYFVVPSFLLRKARNE